LKISPMALAVAPAITKTSVKPAMKASEWSIASRLPGDAVAA